MFLKRIQATGFKSFADKVSVPFDKGITGIVGPNGSGKSNIIDAVRWVMGEQNARNLRGKIATDIIFSGSANRKPQGMCEVSLVFDNNDESAFCPPEYRHEPEITLTRRLYADGQREYMINRKACRLKDIINFFSTTGLGGRSYSMIQQGQVERILNAKPEEMRVIIEEAAGTLIYKIRRDEALKKLTHTKENLSRIEDIVSELDRQKDSLQGQMEKARKWREFSQELETEELGMFAHAFHHFNDQLLIIDQALGSEQEKEAEILATTSVLEAKQVELQNALDAADPGLEGLRESVSSIREQIARAESIIATSDERVEQRKSRLGSLDKELGEDTENLRMIEEQLSAAQEELEKARVQAKNLEGQIETFQSQVDAVDEEANTYQSRVEDYQDELRNIERMLETNSLRCENISRERDRIAKELDEHRGRFESLQSDITDAKKKVDVATAKAAEHQEGLDLVLNRRSELETELTGLNQTITERSHRRDELKEHYFDTKGRFGSLQEIIGESSDVASTLSDLKLESEDAPCLARGLLTDYIAFNDDAKELSKHARSAFESWSERLLIDNFADFNDLVKLAHRTEVGGLPLTVLSANSFVDHNAIQTWAENCEATAIRQYLKVAKPLEGLDELIDRLYLLTNLELSQQDLADLPKGVIAFTSKGIALHSQDEFFLASSKERKGILTRKVELESLAGELKTLEGDLASCQSELDGTVLRANELKIELSDIDTNLREQNQDVLDVLSDLQSTKQILSHKQELFETAKKQCEQLEKNDRDLVEELNDQGQARLNLAQEEERVNEDLSSIKEQAETIEERRTECFKLHENRRLEHAKVETRMQSLEQSFTNTQAQLERVQSLIDRRYNEKSQLEDEIESIRSEHEQSLAEIKVLLGKRETLEKDLLEKREENSAIIDELRKVDGELKKQHEAYSKLEKFVTTKKVEAERLRVELEGIINDANEKYHLEISQHQFERDPEYDHKKKSGQVSRLRSKIEGLGAINMMAIEEYDNLMERHRFITAQREEILNSIAVLEDALEEIEETTEQKFLETYHQINLEFSNLFPILFPGGDGHIALSNAEDPLNSGVEILARLPGKKMQRMTLLSGGEKALTAISLIFALLKTKPTPFCFLDEVDAPLDEANVGRYNRVLETLSERFQFIVITHNRRTMEVLDTLYGVTMQEPGVSKVVGVDMKKDIPDHLKKAFKAPEAARPIEGATVQ